MALGALTETDFDELMRYKVSLDQALTEDSDTLLTSQKAVKKYIDDLHVIVDAMLDFFNGTIIEHLEAVITSDGSIITLTVEQTGGGDLTMNFSDGQTTLDCTPALTLAITAGTDATPASRYIFIPQTTKVLTEGTAWPTTEHIRIAYLLVQSAATVQSLTGTYVNQNWNDHAMDTRTNQGHLTHITQRARRSGAIWLNGCEGIATVDVAETPDAIWVSVATGEVSQMHQHTFAALDSDPAGADDPLFIINHDTTPYTEIDGLHEITADSTGAAIGVNKFFSVVLWGVMNHTGEQEFMIVNVPSGQYLSLAGAQADANHFNNFSIPNEYGLESSTGFLIAQFIIKKGATNYTVEDTINLRGTTPGTAGGSSGTAGDVTAALAMTDNALVKGDGGAKGIQDSGVLLSDADAMTALASLTFSAGTLVNEFSIDDTLGGDSDNAVPTEQAVKAYVDGQTHATGNELQATSAITDNSIVRGDGGVRGTQDTGILIDDSDNVTGIADLDMSGDGDIEGDVVIGPESFTIAQLGINNGGVTIAPSQNIGRLSVRGDTAAVVHLEDGTGTANLHISELRCQSEATVINKVEDDSTTTAMLTLDHATMDGTFVNDLDITTDLRVGGDADVTGDLDAGGDLTANPDADSIHTIGKLKIGLPTGAGADSWHLGHFDNFTNNTDWNIKGTAAGRLILNAPTGQEVQLRVANVNTIQMNATELFPSTDGVTELGTTALRWQEVWSDAGTITNDLGVGGGLDVVGNIDTDGSVFIKEQAAAQADVAAYGQLWVKTATPNQLWFTDDAGTDTQIV